MKERPILMSAPMIRATLSGSKTQTRRVVKQDLQRLGDGDWYAFDHKGINYRVNARHTTVAAWAHLLQFCPYGHPGDRLWVREAFRFLDSFDGDSPNTIGDRCLIAGYPKPWAPTHYEADGLRDNWMNVGTAPGSVIAGKLRPGIHMPRWASRITLEIVSVRVERLQDISEEDAIAEGVYCGNVIVYSYYENGHHEVWEDRYFFDGGPDEGFESAVNAYAALWDSINGEGSWEKNPWVWVIEFRRVVV